MKKFCLGYMFVMFLSFNFSLQAQSVNELAGIAIVSDIHWSAFPVGRAYKPIGQKNFQILPQVFHDTLEQIKNDTDIQMILIPGDLTKDGEVESHESISREFQKLESAGKKIFVIPGNHDYNNPASSDFSGEVERRILTISEIDFAKYYSCYKTALRREPSGLSYVVDLTSKIRLMALDTTRNRENTPDEKYIMSGMLAPPTRAWMQQEFDLAKQDGKKVIVMMHHPVLEHYPNAKKHFPDFTINDFDEVGQWLANNGVRLVFTGHFHAHDISEKEFETKTGKATLVDVETNGLITWPHLWRKGIIRDLMISLKTVSAIPDSKKDSLESSRKFTFDTFVFSTSNDSQKYFIKKGSADKIAEASTRALMNHFAGTEANRPDFSFENDLSWFETFLFSFKKQRYVDMHFDLPPDDHNLEMTL